MEKENTSVPCLSKLPASITPGLTDLVLLGVEGLDFRAWWGHHHCWEVGWVSGFGGRTFLP